MWVVGCTSVSERSREVKAAPAMKELGVAVAVRAKEALSEVWAAEQ